MPERTPNSSTNMKFTLGQGSSQTSVWTDLTYANQWNHIIGIWDGTKITVYLNGKKGNSADVASASYDSTF